MNLLVVAGFAASLGLSARPVTARLTYDPAQAALGGKILVLDGVSAVDEDAVRMSEAVVLAAGGLMSRGALAARAHGVAAVALGGAGFEAGRLALDAPQYGPALPGAGFSFHPVAARARRILEEGEVVTVDAERGTLTLYPPQSQQRELELAQALKAYEGLRDGQALIHWWQGRAQEPDAAALASRLERELAARVVSGSGRAADFGALAQVAGPSLPPGLRPAFRRELARDVLDQSAEVDAALKDIRENLSEVSTAEAARRLGERAEGLCLRLGGLAAQVGLKTTVSCRVTALAAQSRLRAVSGKPAISWRQAAEAAGAAARPAARVDASVYRRFVVEAGLKGPIDDIAGDASLPLARKSERIRALFAAARIAEGSEAARALSRALAGAGPFDFSSADSFHGGVAKADAARALLDSWAGFWSAGPLGARLRASVTDAAPEILVSPALKPSVSGSLYSPDGRLVVSAGDDQYLLARGGRELMAPILGGSRRLLTEQRLKRLARVGRALDDYFGQAVQASFAFADDALYILSAGPSSGSSR